MPNLDDMMNDVVAAADLRGITGIEMLELGHQYFGGDVELSGEERRYVLPLLRVLRSHDVPNLFDAIEDLIDAAGNADNDLYND